MKQNLNYILLRYRKDKMGFAKACLKIRILYRGKWYYASSVDIDKDGNTYVDYCHGLRGSIDQEHVERVIVMIDKTEPSEEKR